MIGVGCLFPESLEFLFADVSGFLFADVSGFLLTAVFGFVCECEFLGQRLPDPAPGRAETNL
jgi:hypothetical protein